MRTIQTYFKLAFADVRSQMQHQASFWMNTVGNLIASGGSFVMIWALFASFGKLGEWSMAEIAVLYGIVNSAYASGADSSGSISWSRQVTLTAYCCGRAARYSRSFLLKWKRHAPGG